MTKAALALTVSLVAALAPSLAEGEGVGQALIRGLDSPKKIHPLADADGRIPVTVTLEPGQTAASLGMREIAKGIAGARLSPSDVLAFDDEHPDVSLLTGPPMRTMLDVSGSWTGARTFREATGSDGTGVIVGVIDTGIDLTHPGFITPGEKTRVAWLLTWGAPQGLHPDVEAAMGCTDPTQSPCAVYAAADIDAMLAKGVLPEDMHDLVGHGTHVTGIAAGNGRTSDGSPARYIGVAPKATIVFAAPSRGGGFPDDAVIRGAQFIFNRADAMGLPAVANFSLGGDYGPHDGTSPVEKALTSLVGDDKPGRAIVVAAGNSGGLYKVGDVTPAGIRTEVRLDDHAPVRVPVLLPNSTGGQVYVWVSYHKTDVVSVGLDGPNDHTWIAPLASGEDAGYDDGKGTSASVINNEDTGKTALNQDNAGAIIAWDGKWAQGSTFAIQLRGHGDVDLWVTATGAALDTGVYFPHATKAGTISVPGTAPNLLAVGCTINRLSWRSFPDGTPIEVGNESPPDSVCYYSSAGPTPTAVPKPEILAPGGYVASALSIDADPRLVPDSIFDGAHDCPNGSQCYVAAQDYVVTAGTSMSTPHVAGAIALLLQHAPNLTQSQLTDILQASARYPTGLVPFDSQAGPGALSMTQALAVMADEMPQSSTPDPGQSWWLLSDETARPDPTFSVWGTIELRLADGTVASGLDGSKLAVLVDGGLLQKPVAKVRHGLFRFAVAGDAGHGGTKMHIQVLYDGVPIGAAKDLPIESDPWIDQGKLTGVGGCTIGARRSDVGGASVAVLFALALIARCRGRRAALQGR